MALLHPLDQLRVCHKTNPQIVAIRSLGAMLPQIVNLLRVLLLVVEKGNDTRAISHCTRIFIHAPLLIDRLTVLGN